MEKQENFIQKIEEERNEKLYQEMKKHQLEVEKQRLEMQKNYSSIKFTENDADLLQRLHRLAEKSKTPINPDEIITAINQHIDYSQKSNDSVYISNQTPRNIAITEINSINNNLEVEERHELYEIINELLIRNKFVPRESPNAKIPALEKERKY